MIKWSKNDLKNPNRNNQSQLTEKRLYETSRRPPCGQTSVEQTVFSGLCDAWIRADCSNSSSCWERLASSDSKDSTCKNKTGNLCFPPPSPSVSCSAALGGNALGKRAWIGASELEMTQTRPRAAPSGYSRCRCCQEALEWERWRKRGCASFW